MGCVASLEAQADHDREMHARMDANSHLDHRNGGSYTLKEIRYAALNELHPSGTALPTTIQKHEWKTCK